MLDTQPLPDPQPEPAPEPKPWYWSKTVWFNINTALLSVLAFIVSEQFPLSLPPEATQWIIAVMGIGNIILRFVTFEPIK